MAQGGSRRSWMFFSFAAPLNQQHLPIRALPFVERPTQCHFQPQTPVALLRHVRCSSFSPSAKVAPQRIIGQEHTEHIMARRQPASKPTWADVKAELATFGRPGLLALIKGLYAAHKDNQKFLHARFGLGEDVLKPYKQTLDRWLWPDVLRSRIRPP